MLPGPGPALRPGQAKAQEPGLGLCRPLEHGNISQKSRCLHGSQYAAAAAAAAACRGHKQLFQNGTTVAGMVCQVGLISDSFSAYQSTFLSKTLSESCSHLQCKCHAIPWSQLLVMAAQNWLHECHGFSMIREAITIPIRA